MKKNLIIIFLIVCVIILIELRNYNFIPHRLNKVDHVVVLMLCLSIILIKLLSRKSKNK